MKHKVGNTNTEIEVGQYKEVNKGALKAFFSIIEYPHGRKTLDCRYFVSGNNRWFNFPQKEIKKPDQEKPDYLPLVSYIDKEYLEKFKETVLKALMEQENGNSHQGQKNSLQGDTSPVWF